MLNKFVERKHKRKGAARSDEKKDDTKKTGDAPKKAVSGVEGIEEENIFNIDFDDLDFESPIGKGSFGKVWKGDYFGTPVAIKRFKEGPMTGLDTERLQRYIWREITVLKSLRHPNFVQFMGLCTHETGQFLITEYIEGGDLRHYLLANPGISWKQRCMILRDVAIAMTFLHRKGIIHRDLKLENLLITDNCRIKICDLGLARVAEKERYMTIAGSDEYMAPEVMLGDKYDEKCDVFSFGIIIGVLVGESRLPARSRASNFAFKIEQLKALTARSCPKPLADLFVACCLANPTERPSFKDALEILKTLVDEMTQAPAPVPESVESSGTDITGEDMSQQNTTIELQDDSTIISDGTTVRRSGSDSESDSDSSQCSTTIMSSDTTVHKEDSTLKAQRKMSRDEDLFDVGSESYQKAQILKRRILELRAEIERADKQEEDHKKKEALLAEKREAKKQKQQELGRASLPRPRTGASAARSTTQSSTAKPPASSSTTNTTMPVTPAAIAAPLSPKKTSPTLAVTSSTKPATPTPSPIIATIVPLEGTKPQTPHPSTPSTQPAPPSLPHTAPVVAASPAAPMPVPIITTEPAEEAGFDGTVSMQRIMAKEMSRLSRHSKAVHRTQQ